MTGRNGSTCFATAAGQTDAPRAWRAARAGNGCVIDAANGEVVAGGRRCPIRRGCMTAVSTSAMPAPAKSGIETASGRFNPIAFYPGVVRGVAFARNSCPGRVVIAAATPRFFWLALDDRLKLEGRGRAACFSCMIQVINRDSVTSEHWLALGGVVRELYDIAPRQGTSRVRGTAVPGPRFCVICTFRC